MQIFFFFICCLLYSNIYPQDAVIAKGDRIEELEEALKESVRITAEREMVMVEQQQQLEEAEQKVSRAKVKARSVQC